MSDSSGLHSRCSQARKQGRKDAQEARKTGARREDFRHGYTDPHLIAAWRDAFDAESQGD